MPSRKTIRRMTFLVFNILIMLFLFFIVQWIKLGSLEKISGDYFFQLMLVLDIWIFISVMFDKYQFVGISYKKILYRILKSGFVSLGLISIIIFIFRLFSFSRGVVFGTLTSTTILEIGFSAAYYYSNKIHKYESSYSNQEFISEYDQYRKKNKLRETFGNPQKVAKKYKPGFSQKQERYTAYDILRDKYLAENSTLFQFISERVDLSEINENSVRVLKTNTLYNIKNTQEKSLGIFMNIIRLNEFVDITKYLNQVNKILKPGGVFIAKANTVKQIHEQIREKYNAPVANFIYFLNYIFHEHFPKIKLLDGIYYKLRKSINRFLSMTEILGRLKYTGFDIIDTIEIDNKIYYLCKKSEPPAEPPHPSYGPVFKTERIGKHGKRIKLYKFRTMHPFSEYLHSYIARKYGYSDNGKLEKDFRKTRVGKFLRKTWLDELPQLINFIKGELSLVGVRAFSDEYLKNYPESHIKRRSKYKPGCIPTYVCLNMDNGHKARIKSERIYLMKKAKNPILTDIKFFFMAIYNILFGKVSTK